MQDWNGPRLSPEVVYHDDSTMRKFLILSFTSKNCLSSSRKILGSSLRNGLLLTDNPLATKAFLVPFPHFKVVFLFPSIPGRVSLLLMAGLSAPLALMLSL